MTNVKEDNLIFNMPFPILVLNEDGKVCDANEKIADVFLYDGLKDADCFAIMGYKYEQIANAIEEGDRLTIERNDKVFRLNPYYVEEEGIKKIVIVFYDITNFEDLKDRYNAEKPAMVKIEIDNYDELIDPTGLAPKTELASAIDSLIREWINEYSGTITRVNRASYVSWIEQGNIEKITEKKFDILDKIRELETGEDYPASLSIGVGIGGKSMQETEEFADCALDLSLGRGGDQAVIRRKQKSEFYGGQNEAVEKNNKGKARIIGHALKQLIEQADKVIIMGHRASDMDSFGACLGIARLAVLSNKQAYIVIDEVTESLRPIFEEAMDVKDYEIVSSEKAIELAKEESLLVIADTHRPSIVQCPELLNICEKIAIIDHHRKLDDMVEDPTLSYMESYVSSASEMVSEILQFMIEKGEIEKLEAEALLAGISVDTNGFSQKTGVRTFEAAAWLRRQGADPTEIKRLFQEDVSLVKLKSDALARTEIYKDTIAITEIKDHKEDVQTLCAKVADQLLTIRGVKCSFALGENSEHKTVISARSLGEVNVQVIMEKLGGGGHLSIAAAQSDLTKEEVKCKILEIMEAK